MPTETTDLVETFRANYRNALIKRYESGNPEYAYPWARGKSGADLVAAADDIYRKACLSIVNGYERADHYNGNPALREAGKSVGFKTAREFRDWVRLGPIGYAIRNA